jgi:hypothetical protein
MVMERLGMDLQKISDKNGPFKKSTVLQLGIRMVRRHDLFHMFIPRLFASYNVQIFALCGIIRKMEYFLTNVDY